MLKIGMRPGEYVTVGDDVKIIFSGGTGNHIHLLIDAPKEKRILRSSYGENEDKRPYYREESLTKEQLDRAIARQKRKKEA